MAKQAKLTHTSRYFMGRPPDGTIHVQGPDKPLPEGCTPIPRLAINEIPACDYESEDLAELIERSPEDAVFFCDANMFINTTDDLIWDALFQRRRTYVIPPVYRELSQWLDDPRGTNLKAHAFVSQMLERDKELPVVPFQIWNDETIQISYEHYVNLLSARKRALEWVRIQYQNEQGSEPTKDELTAYCQALIGVRGYKLAKDGATRLESGSPNFYTDEELVTTAFFHGIVTGKETIVLSRDEHVQEQFVKLKFRMVDHYCSMALANRYADDPLSLITRPMPMDNPMVLDVFSGGNNLLVARPSQHVDLTVPIGDPFTNRSVPIYCWLPRHHLTQTCFAAETGMGQLLNIKGTTRGMSTDLLQGRNCHIYMGNGLSKVLRNWAAIVEEVHVPLGRAKNTGLLDLKLVISNDERFMRAIVVDPNKIILPGGRA